MHHLMAEAAAARVLESTLRGVCEYDSMSGQLFAPLEGSTVGLRHSTAPSLTVDFRAFPPQIGVDPGTSLADDESAYDAVITISPLELLRCVRQGTSVPLGSVAGNHDIANQFIAALGGLRPDLSEPLAEVLGDRIAGTIVNGTRTVFDMFRFARDQRRQPR